MGYNKIVLNEKDWKEFRKRLNNWCQMEVHPDMRGTFLFHADKKSHVFQNMNNVIQITDRKFLLVSHKGDGDDFIVQVSKREKDNKEDMKLRLANEINARLFVYNSKPEEFNQFLIDLLVLASEEPTGIPDELKFWIQDFRRLRTRNALINFIDQDDDLLLPEEIDNWINPMLGQAYANIQNKD